MLRYAFFPDFKSGPKLLLWGGNTDMAALSAFLRREVAFSELGFWSAAGDTVIVMPQEGATGGVIRVKGEEKAFRWKLDASTAEWFAELIDVLAEPSCSGHQYLEHFRSLSDIVVMASCGEYPATGDPQGSTRDQRHQ
jgi:hypothetical protein